jgi:hypothetical protein
MSSADNADWARSIETVVADWWPAIQLVDEPEIDGRTVEPIEADGGHTVVESGTEIEVKACRIQVAGGRSGRWWLRERNHTRLLDDGVYALAVYSPGEGAIRRLSLIGAGTMDVLVSDRWTDPGARHEAQRCAQLPWTEVIQTLEYGPDIEIGEVVVDER